ncbi:MAG: undecaprenyldiphospho-muramoylpentapeptide beta-N-acetylglucosaminyltransferase [Nitrospinae bacterium]|nr:undecaprenyldiphospho-muramoylpentapeptide beta-N-acetylglucosaminyltransferase [Nitrospinota bacterium]
MPIRVVIAGGGTGGHLYPGIALAKALMKHGSDIEITFVGTRQGIETSVLPREGFKLKTILSSGLIGKKGVNRWISWCKLPAGLAQSLCFLVRNKPDLAVGVGGYASGPLVLSAWVLRIPILIHEQNVVPGVTNKWLGKIADRVAVSFKESLRYFPSRKTVHTGNMIREEICELKEAAPAEKPERFVVLVLGGSQGAHSINKGMVQALDHLSDLRDSLHFIHQTGTRDADETRAGYERKEFSAEVQPFIFDVAEAYRKAALVICRAGATTLAEISACGKVSVLIPFPYAAHGHQEQNARVIEAAGAGEAILDRDVTGESLSSAIRRAMRDPERMREMSENSYSLGNRDAAEKVKQMCLELLETARGMTQTDGNPIKKSRLSCF